MFLRNIFKENIFALYLLISFNFDFVYRSRTADEGFFGNLRMRGDSDFFHISGMSDGMRRDGADVFGYGDFRFHAEIIKKNPVDDDEPFRIFQLMTAEKEIFGTGNFTGEICFGK